MIGTEKYPLNLIWLVPT